MENDYTTGGYNCGVCGEYIPHNTIHVCGGSKYPPQVPAPTYNFTAGDTKFDSETQRKLNEIIELLKSIRRRL